MVPLGAAPKKGSTEIETRAWMPYVIESSITRCSGSSPSSLGRFPRSNVRDPRKDTMRAISELGFLVNEMQEWKSPTAFSMAVCPY